MWGVLAIWLLGFSIEMGWYALLGTVLSTPWVRQRYARGRATLERILGSALVLAGVRMSGD